MNHHTIINSAIELAVLNLLQRHLNSYFVDNDIDRSRIVTLSRDQLGANVLKNRVIDQLTKDMDERPIFSRNTDSGRKGTVFYSVNTDGAVYTRIDIELPEKSTIIRNSNGRLVITNPMFELTLKPAYEGFATALPHAFMPSQDPPFAPRLVSLTMRIRIKRTALLTGGSMEMYEWLDSLVERMHDYISTDRLQQRLDADLVEMFALTSKIHD